MKITESHTKLFGQGHLQPFQSNAIFIADVKISRQETPDRFSATDPEKRLVRRKGMVVEAVEYPPVS